MEISPVLSTEQDSLGSYRYFLWTERVALVLIASCQSWTPNFTKLVKPYNSEIMNTLFMTEMFHILCTANVVAVLCDVLAHDDVIKWKHFPRFWSFSLHKGQLRGAFMFSLICAWINGWVNNGEAGDVRRHRAHYDVTVMYFQCCTVISRHVLKCFGLSMHWIQ